MRLLANGGRETMIRDVFQAIADRNNMIRSGMERGVTDGFVKLDGLLGEIG